MFDDRLNVGADFAAVGAERRRPVALGQDGVDGRTALVVFLNGRLQIMEYLQVAQHSFPFRQDLQVQAGIQVMRHLRQAPVDPPEHLTPRHAKRAVGRQFLLRIQTSFTRFV